MTNIEAINFATDQQSIFGNMMYEYLVVSKEALNKQVPATPTFKKTLNNSITMPHCAQCGSRLEGCIKYCPECGQKIDWEIDG